MPIPPAESRQADAEGRLSPLAVAMGADMPNYRLVFAERLTGTPIRSFAFTAKDARDAFLLAQDHDGPAELWSEKKHLCTLLRTGSCGEIWVLSGKRLEPTAV